MILTKQAPAVIVRTIIMLDPRSHCLRTQNVASRVTTSKTTPRHVPARLSLFAIVLVGLVFVLYHSCQLLEPFGQLLHEVNGPYESLVENEYMSPQEMNDRARRFPSLQDRLKIYLLHYFAPPCDQSTSSGVVVQFQYEYKTTKIPHVIVQELATWDRPGTGRRTFRIAELVASSEHKHSGAIARSGSSSNGSQLETLFYLNRETAIHYGCVACKEVSRTLLPVLARVRDRGHVRTPILLNLGDGSHLNVAGLESHNVFTGAYSLDNETLLWNPALPYLRRYRMALTRTQVSEITTVDCVKGRRFEGHILSIPPQPILWMFKANRHLFAKLRTIRRYDRPWADKSPTAVFRGGMTDLQHQFSSFWPDPAGRGIDQDLCLSIPQCRLVMYYGNVSGFDVRVTTAASEGTTTTPSASKLESGSPYWPLLLGDNLDIRTILSHKMIIVLEDSHDLLASPLPWALYSQSVVLMPPPTRTTFLMEERLLPFVHYIPLDLNLTNLQARVQWVQDNDLSAKRIARAGALWIKDLYYHPWSHRENHIILDHILKRYQSMFVHQPFLNY